MERFDEDDGVLSSDCQQFEAVQKSKKPRGKRRTAENDRINLPSKRAKNDVCTTATLPYHGYPTEHPYNKDGYFYILAEPDPHADRTNFELDSWAGKPIPGEIYRTALQPDIYLALHDRAPQLKVSEDRLSVTGDKGYSAIRGNYGVNKGSWYFEVIVTEMPIGSAVRLGWSQIYGNLQAPLGYDKFSYSWRSRKGTRFHQSRGKHYSDGYGQGDVLGFLISFPDTQKQSADTFPKTYKDRALIRFKNHLHYEEKDVAEEIGKTMKQCVGSSISFFKNGNPCGIAFTDIYEGMYYPAASLYKSASVRFNFGPDVRCPPKGYAPLRMYSERVTEAAVEQSLSDALYLAVFAHEQSRNKSNRKK